MLNPFGTDAFNMVSLTGAINILPNRYGKIGNLGLFSDKPVTTRSVVVEERNGVLCLLPSLPVGSPGTVGVHPKRTVRSFTVPHIPHDDVILPSDFQGVRAFGSETEMQTLDRLVNDRLQLMKDKHAITLEWLRMGALKGIIYDGDGATVLYNLYTEFGISPKTVDFVLGTGSTNVKSKVLEVKRHIEDNAKGAMFSGVGCECSPEFWDAFTDHEDVKEAFLNHSEASQRYGEDNRAGFRFMGVVFSEYRGNADDASGANHKFITAKHAHFYPIGAPGVFQTIYAPGNFLETANTLGLALYAKMVERPKGDGMDLFTESNPLPICNRPGMLVDGYTA